MSSIEQLYPINGGATAALILVRWTSVIEADTISAHVRLAPGAKNSRRSSGASGEGEAGSYRVIT
jgi:hypothetical protein